MKLRKVLAGAVASILAVSSLAISANAALYVPNAEVTDESGNVLGTLDKNKQLLDEDKNVIGTLGDDCISVVDADGNVIGKCAEQQPANGLSIESGAWLIQLYNVGDASEGKPATDYGIDVTKVASMTMYLEAVRGADEELAVDLDMYDPAIDGFGGNFIYSANGGTIGKTLDSPVYKEAYVDENGTTVPAVTMYAKYNWPNSNEWWGLPEEGDTPEGFENGNTGTVDYSKKLHMEYIRKFAYSLTYDVAHDDSAEDIVWPEGADCNQVGIQEWGEDYSINLKVRAFVCNDIDGNIMLAFDGLGNKIEESELNTIIEDLSQPYVPAAPAADETEAEETEAPAENASENNNDDSAAETTAATTTTAASTSSSSSNVGLIIGIIAVVVVVIVVVVIIVIKKKK
ncbi:MAG: hypothetical protein NC394_01020 [Bacteroides sp.]|nr:hypothetical protein [Bacteroides sp.]